MATEPTMILSLAFQRAAENQNQSLIHDPNLQQHIALLARNTQNRACARFILACALAKAHRPELDIRKPYTEIGTSDAYSGRSYDERYIFNFITRHELPCNATTAFLTPAFRNRNTVLTPDLDMAGRPPQVYKATLQLLDAVHNGEITAESLLTEMIRQLLIVRDEKHLRMQSLLSALQATAGETNLSADGIVALVEQHLKLKHTSRLPVLIVAAAYQAAQEHLGEQIIPLARHNAADKQTGALGDLAITLRNDEHIITAYEMKNRRVTKGDIDIAVGKIVHAASRIDNYIFITTSPIEPEVVEYAMGMYEQLGGIEITILDCINFLRYFLHLFYRLRTQFLETYQSLLLEEPDSAVSQPLKEAFLAMRQAAESH